MLGGRGGRGILEHSGYQVLLGLVLFSCCPVDTCMCCY